MKEIKAVIFDMDGVILDSETICDRCWLIAAKEFGIKEPGEILKRCLGCNKTDSVLIIKECLGQNFDSEKFLLRTSQLFHEIENTEGVPLLPYAKECLEKLHGKYRIALASSTREESVRRLLKRAGVLDFFETITTGDMVEHSKPDPEIYLKACSSLKLNPDECIAIEDSPNGIKSGYRAGMQVIMVPDKIQPNEELLQMTWKVCKSLKEVAEIL